MPGTSSKPDWVYAIEKDFKSTDGSPATYAPLQPAYYGDEDSKIQLTSKSSASSLNADGTLLAVEQGHNIHIYSIEDKSLLQILRGHVSRVDSIEFHPTEPTKLVSCAMCHQGGSVEAECTILFWDLSENPMKNLLNETALESVGKRAMEGAVGGLESSGALWRPDEDEKAGLVKDFAKSIEALNVKSRIQSGEKLHGRLVDRFRGRSFNRDGSRMIYLPGERPWSNRVDDWDICIWDIVRKETTLTLHGHTDAIMWIGFSPDDNVIGSVSWDKTFRIWSSADGSLLHTFHSSSQNWTGAFSPDSRFFAGTTVGRLWVWDVVHGVEVATYTWSHSFIWGCWCRSLDWSPNGKQIVVGGENRGYVFVFDIKTQKIVQERVLSLELCSKDPENDPDRIGQSMEVYSVQWFDQGRKIVYWTTGDYAVEVYDFETNKKWRFAPNKGEGDWATRVFILEDGKVILAVDADVVRFWRLDAGQRRLQA